MLMLVVMILINNSAEAGPDDSRPGQYFVDPIKRMRLIARNGAPPPSRSEKSDVF